MPVIIPIAARHRRRWSRARLAAADDAGVERTIATFQSGDIPDIHHHVARCALARLRSEAATRRLGSPRLYVALSTSLIVALACAVPVGLVLAMRFLRVAPIWVMLGMIPGFAIMFGLTVLTSSTLMGRGLGESVSLIIDAILRMGRCASCGYPMGAVHDEGDGFQQCPECGATWRAERIGREPVPAAIGGVAARARGMIVMAAMCRSRRRDARGRIFEPLTFFQVTDGDVRMRRRTVERAARPLVALSILIPIAGVAASVGVALWLRASWWTLALVMLTVVAAIGALVALVRHSARRTIRLELRVRLCPACYHRLRREGDLLTCAGCDGAWLRPTRTRR